MGRYHGWNLIWAFVVSTLLGLMATPAHASETPPSHANIAGTTPNDATQPPIHNHHHIIAARLLSVAGFSSHGEDSLAGVGIFYELVLLPNWLELEVSFAALFNSERQNYPIDVLIKKPFVISDTVEVHAGIGALANIVRGGRHDNTYPGAIATVDGYIWTTPALGFLMEFNYAIVAEEMALHELEGAIGVAYRF